MTNLVGLRKPGPEQAETIFINPEHLGDYRFDPSNPNAVNVEGAPKDQGFFAALFTQHVFSQLNGDTVTREVVPMWDNRNITSIDLKSGNPVITLNFPFS